MRLRQIAPAAIGAIIFLCASTSFAHEKWFYEAETYRANLKNAFKSPEIFGVIAAVVLTGLMAIVWRAIGRRDLPGPRKLGATDQGLTHFYAIVPLILGIHVGVPLIVLGVQGQLFTPNNHLEGVWRPLIGVAEIGIGLSFLYGGMARLSGILLLIVWTFGIGLFGLEPMLESLHYVGFAAFFFLTGRGPYAIDRLLFPVVEPREHLAAHAMTALRIGIGLGFTVVAFTEKLANPQLAMDFLKTYPLNFTPWLGIAMPDEVFVTCAGAVELMIGLTLTFGLFPRVIICTAWIFINMTLTIFNWVELVGHLPLYGVMAVLLTWTPSEDDRRLWMRGVLKSEISRA